MNRNQLSITILVSVAVAVFTCPLFGQIYPDTGAGIEAPEYQRVASTGFQFLKLPTDARAAAMGGVLSTLSHGGASMAISNPASIADVQGIDVSVSQMSWIADIDYFNGALVKNFGSKGNFGLSFIYLDYGSLTRSFFDPVFDDQGNYTFNVEQQLNVGTFSASDMAFGISYGRNITDRLQFGVNVKYAREEIDDASTGNMLVDVGTVYYTGLKSFRVSMLGRNFGTDANFLGYDEQIRVEPFDMKMPMTFVLGAAIDVLEGRTQDDPLFWTLAGEFIHTNDASEKINLGTELILMNILALRGGYRAHYDEEGVTVGAGLNIHTGDMALRIDGAYIDFGRFDNVTMFTLHFGF